MPKANRVQAVQPSAQVKAGRSAILTLAGLAVLLLCV
jgi:hypothetical protein